VLINASEIDGERMKTSFRQTDIQTDRPSDRFVYFRLGFDFFLLYWSLGVFFLLLIEKGNLDKVIVELQEKEGSKKGRDRSNGGWMHISRRVGDRTVFDTIAIVPRGANPVDRSDDKQGYGTPDLYFNVGKVKLADSSGRAV
jgi:hypothetical protein